MDLFAAQQTANLDRAAPLAVRMRPRTLDEFVGQEHFLGPGRLLRRLIQADRLSSTIFHGPPGCGKTTLAHIVAGATSAHFESLHAAEATVRDVRAILEQAAQRVATAGQRTLLFLDEIHRFNRGQQDVLLDDVERGLLILIGATTDNPYFSLNAPLISRSTVFRFEPLSPVHIRTLLERALRDEKRGLATHRPQVEDAALEFLAQHAEGDARRALNALEVTVLSCAKDAGPLPIRVRDIEESMQRKVLQHDADGDRHYDVASAFIKSMRGSDPDAALYWLACMLEGGDDPRFIARRICICASEDVGTADGQALVIAAAAAQVTEFVGLPECEYALAHAAVHVACAPKSAAVTRGLSAAKTDVREKPALPVPRHLRDRSYASARKLGHGEGYQYPHDFPEGFVVQDYLGAERRYYEPTANGDEASIGQRLARLRAAVASAKGGERQ